MNTTLHYQYRDADNYKVQGRATFAGELDDAKIRNFMEHLDQDGSLIPGQVGLPDLQNQFSGGSHWDPTRDHPWHELIGIEVSPVAASMDVTIDEFVERVLATTWDSEWKPSFYAEMSQKHADRSADPEPS